MLKQNLLATLVTTLTLSTSGMVFAMEEDHDQQNTHAKPVVAFFSDSHEEIKNKAVLPVELQVEILSFVPGEELLNVAMVSKHWNELVRDPHVQETIIEQIFPKSKIAKKISELTTPQNGEPLSKSSVEFLVGRFQEAVIKHIKYGFTPQFILKVFNADIMYAAMQKGMCVNLEEYEPRCYPLRILNAQFNVEKESSSDSSGINEYIKRKITILFESHPAFQEYDASFGNRFYSFLDYASHFTAIFRFIEGMTEEQKGKTIELLSPHLHRKNFGNFYPKLIEGLDSFDVGDLNFEGKIEWLSRTLETYGYFNNDSFYKK